LRSAGATQEDVEELGNVLFREFNSVSSADDQREGYKAYEKAIEIILKRNGVKDEVIQKGL
jgi:hypothetical protein